MTRSTLQTQVDQQKPIRILVFRPDQRGDVLLTTPVFRWIKTQLPEAFLISLTGPWTADLLEGNPYIDKRLYYAFCFHNLRNRRYSTLQKLENILGILRLVRQERVDVFIDLRVTWQTALICYLSGAKRRLGKKRGLLSVFFTDTVDDTEDKYEKDTNLQIASLLAGTQSEIPSPLEFHTTEQDRLAARLLISTLENKPLVSIFPYASYVAKQIPPDYFSQIIKYLNTRGFGCVLLGGGESRAFAGGISFDAAQNINITEKTNLKEAFEIVRLSKFCISLDSFGAHLAIAADKPGFVIFTNENPHRWIPISAKINWLVRVTKNCPPWVKIPKRDVVKVEDFNYACLEGKIASSLDTAGRT